MKKSQIRIDVNLDEENLPSFIEWDADDADFEGKQPAKGVMLSLFDGLQKQAMRIDLWTNDMQIDEMNLFMFQTLATMADTYERATNNKEIAEEMNLSPRTIDTYRDNLFKKLQIKTRTGLAIFAIKNNIIDI